MTNNFDSQKIGDDPRWWTGIIVDDVSWKGNQVAEKWSSIDQLPGWGARYKVRIVGKHTQDRNKLPDDKLELCEVLYPVTAGTGHAASYQTSNLRKGSVVFGIYKDSEGNEPLIIGCIGNNEQTYLNRSQGKGFDTLSAFSADISVPYYSIVPGGSPPITGPNNETKIETNSNSSESRTRLQDQDEVDENSSSVSVSADCDKAQLGAIQLEIKNLIRDIEKVKKQSEEWKQVLTKGIQDVEQYIKLRVQKASEFISGGIKWVITEIQKKITEKVNNTAKDFYYTLFPSQRPKLKRAMETVNDLIACLFRKIISNLIKMVAKFLLQAVDRFINTPLCAVENMVGALLGKITGLINSGLDAILAPVNALLGAFDLVGDIIGFLVDILTFLSCDEKGNCPEVKEWNIWDGPSNVPRFDLNSLVNKAKTFASNVSQSVDPNNFDFDLDFSDVFVDSCNVGAVFCGPPTVEFFGGGGSGATGNAVIGANGEILGVDILTSGSGYTSPPFINFVDACGNGKSATGRAIIGPIDENGNNGVIDIIIDNPGTGYLSNTDGSLGGDGRTWAKSNQTTVLRSDGTYDTPYNPGNIIKLSPGDKVCIPPNSSIEIGSQIITGGCTVVNDNLEIESPMPITNNKIAGQYPSLNSGEYPVIISLENIIIQNGGFGYNDGDKIVIEPSNGASAIPKFGAFGSLESIRITTFGEGFLEVPKIYIDSKTGSNAVLSPKFKINSISTNEMAEPTIQDQIISVVDCVGKVPITDFFRVPR